MKTAEDAERFELLVTGNKEPATGNFLSMAKRKRVRSLRCPTCKKLVLRDELEFPFCSGRCRLIDLGKWASNAYVVSTPIFDPDEPEQVGPTKDDPTKPDGGSHKHERH